MSSHHLDGGLIVLDGLVELGLVNFDDIVLNSRSSLGLVNFDNIILNSPMRLGQGIRLYDIRELDTQGSFHFSTHLRRGSSPSACAHCRDQDGGFELHDGGLHG